MTIANNFFLIPDAVFLLALFLFLIASFKDPGYLEIQEKNLEVLII